MTTPKPTPEEEKAAREWLTSNGDALTRDHPIIEQEYGWVAVSDGNAKNLAALLARVREEGRQQGEDSVLLAAHGHHVCTQTEAARQQGREERDAELGISESKLRSALDEFKRRLGFTG